MATSVTASGTWRESRATGPPSAATRRGRAARVAPEDEARGARRHRLRRLLDHHFVTGSGSTRDKHHRAVRGPDDRFDRLLPALSPQLASRSRVDMRLSLSSQSTVAPAAAPRQSRTTRTPGDGRPYSRCHRGRRWRHPIGRSMRRLLFGAPPPGQVGHGSERLDQYGRPPQRLRAADSAARPAGEVERRHRGQHDFYRRQH
jgi:hypothetical protein